MQTHQPGKNRGRCKRPDPCLQESAARFCSPCPGRCVKVGRLAFDPPDKFDQRFIGKQCFPIHSYPRELGIGEIGVDRIVADRMNRDRFTPLLRFGHRMVPLDANSHFPFT